MPDYESYLRALVVAVLTRASCSLYPVEIVERAEAMALENGGRPFQLRALSQPFVRRMAMTGAVRRDGTRDRYLPGIDGTGPMLIPRPPALPDRPLAAPRKRRTPHYPRQANIKTIAAQALLVAPQVRRTPEDPAALRAFAEDAERVLARAYHDIQELRRKHRIPATVGSTKA